MPGLFVTTANPPEPAELRRVELFTELDDAELVRLARRFVELAIPAEGLIFREGEPAEAFYVIREGSVSVFRDAVGVPVHLLARLGRYDFFGELALYGGGRHSASVRASEPCRILKVTQADFLDFLDDHPFISQKLQATAARRHTDNMATTLDLGRRREVRIRCNCDVELRLVDGSARQVTLENLSVGGLCLTPAPASWLAGQEVSFWLGLREGELELSGRVAWRRGDDVGLAFVKRSPNHDMIIQMATRLLLEWRGRGAVRGARPTAGDP